MYVLDISHPGEPQVLTHDRWMIGEEILTLNGYVYAFTDSRLDVLDISDPATLDVAAAFKMKTKNYGINIHVFGDYIMLVNSRDGVYLFEPYQPSK